MPWLRRLHPLITPVVRLVWRFKRGMTLGVRGLVTDPEGRVLLIQHTYVHGWHMPGGGVERGETIEHALIRELQEEAGVKVIGRPRLVTIHANHRVFRGDHVVLYRVEQWETCAASQQGEIRQIGWFAPGALPDDISPGTRRRIIEALGGAEGSLHW